MQLNYKLLGIYTLVIIALSVGITKRLWPTIQSSTKIEEREVVRKDVQTVIKEVVRPDGTKETSTTIIDRSKESSKKTLEQLVTKKNDWFVAAGAEAKLNNLNEQTYKLEVNRRVLGDIFMGATVNTKGVVGLQLGFTF
jgi:hypothetical protein